MGGATLGQGGISALRGGKGGNSMTGQQQLPGSNSGLNLSPAAGLEALIAQRAAQQQMGGQIAQQLAPAAMYMDPSMAGALLNQRVSPDYAFAQQMQALKAPSYREAANYTAPETPAAAAARTSTTGVTASPLETILKAVVAKQSGPGPNGDR
jgi:hypothetical protein